MPAICIEVGCGLPRDGRFRRCGPCRNSVRRYGLSTAQRQEMLEAQGSKCALCCKPIEFNGRTKSKSAIVDHCHRTGRVRGVICTRCNILMAQIDGGVPIDRLLSYIQGVAQ